MAELRAITLHCANCKKGWDQKVDMEGDGWKPGEDAECPMCKTRYSTSATWSNDDKKQLMACSISGVIGGQPATNPPVTQPPAEDAGGNGGSGNEEEDEGTEEG